MYQKRNRLIADASRCYVELIDKMDSSLRSITIKNKCYCADRFTVLACMELPSLRAFLLSRFAETGGYSEDEFARAIREFCALPDENPFWGMPPEQHAEYMQTHIAPGDKLITYGIFRTFKN